VIPCRTTRVTLPWRYASNALIAPDSNGSRVDVPRLAVVFRRQTGPSSEAAEGFDAPCPRHQRRWWRPWCSCLCRIRASAQPILHLLQMNARRRWGVGPRGSTQGYSQVKIEESGDPSRAALFMHRDFGMSVAEKSLHLSGIAALIRPPTRPSCATTRYALSPNAAWLRSPYDKPPLVSYQWYDGLCHDHHNKRRGRRMLTSLICIRNPSAVPWRASSGNSPMSGQPGGRNPGSPPRPSRGINTAVKRHELSHLNGEAWGGSSGGPARW
jgi:hypothetical protein